MMFIKKLFPLVCLILSFSLLKAQENIKIHGNKKIPSQTILFYTDLKSPSKNTAADINKSLKSLYSTGFFQDVKIKFENNSYIVDVRENPSIKNITFKGNKKFNSKDLANELQSKEGSIYSKYRIENDINKISALYKKFGYYSVVISYVTKKTDGNVDINIDINEGSKPVIREIQFIGNKNFSDTELKEVIASKKYAWYRFFSNQDTYDKERLSYDNELLKRFYMTKGYLNLHVLSSYGEVSPKRDSFLLTYSISEGDKFHFDTPEVDNGIRRLQKDDLVALIDFSKGAVFDIDLVESSVEKFSKYLGDKGYTFVSIDYDIQQNEAQKTAKVVFYIKETSKYYINKINISGNHRTLDRVIRRELRIREEDPFSSSKINRSKQRLANLAYFENIEIEPSHSSQDNKVDLDVKVKEISTGSLGLNFGYSTMDGVLGSIDIAEHNFLGKGQTVELGISRSSKKADIVFGFTEPKFADRNLELGFDIFTSTKNQSRESSYSERSKGLVLRMGYGVTEYLYHKLHYSISKKKLSFEDKVSEFIKAQPTKRVSSSIGHSLIYDRLDNRINPTSGYLLKFGQDLAGLGGNVKYIKNTLTGSYYYPLYKDKVILNLIGRAGDIRGIGGKKVYTDNNFFIGEEYIRGFDVAGIGPRQKYNNTDPTSGKKGGIGDIHGALGAKTFLTGTVEMQFPIGLPKDYGVRGAVFSDVGSAFGNDAYKFKDAPSKDKMYDNKKWRSSYGFGIIWDSPFGFIRLDYAWPIKKQPFDKLERLRFSLGTNF